MLKPDLDRHVAPTSRLQHSRDDLRYSTDLADAEWSVIEALLPPACRLGRPRLWSMREIVNGIVYVMRGGIAWRPLPKDLPPKSTVCGYLSAWRDSGLFAGIDAKRRPSGLRRGQRVKGRKRQALVDTDGRALVLDPQPADIQDRDGTVPVLKQSRR